MRLKKLFVNAVVILVMLTGLSFSAHADNSLEHIAGAGIGLPYGGIIGANYELGINDYVAGTIGFGYLPENFGYNLGVRLYYPERDYVLRGRFTALYGTTAVHKRIDASGSNYKTDTGLSFGIGFEWRFSVKWGFCGDLFYANSDTPAGYEEKDDDLFIALGFNYRF